MDNLTPSDLNLKEDISPILDSSEVLKLRAVSFRLKGGTKMQFGFIAQQIEQTDLANIVFKDPRGVRSVGYNQLIPLLLHQIQELQARLKHVEEFLTKKHQ